MKLFASLGEDKIKKLIVSGFIFILSFVLLNLPYVQFYLKNTDSAEFLRGFEVLAGSSFSLGGTEYTLSQSIWVVYFALSLRFISIILFIVSLFINNRLVTKILNSVGIGMIIISISLLLLYSFIAVKVEGFTYTSIINGKEKDIFKFSTETWFAISYSLMALCMLYLQLKDIISLKRYTIREIAETSILLALSIVLDKYARIPIFPQSGGSINFSAIPLFIIAIRHGFGKGFIASSIFFGIITCLLDGYGFYTYPFDYFIGFAGYAFVGLFVNISRNYALKKHNERKIVYEIIAIAIAFLPVVIIRYIGAMLSGWILYETPFIENFIYQSSYVPLSALVSIAGLILIYHPLVVVDRIFPQQKTI